MTDPAPRDDWQKEAACAHHDHPEWGFPQVWGLTDSANAKKVCWEECPVRAECETFAIENREVDGIWGGYSVKELRKVAKGRRASRFHGLCRKCAEPTRSGQQVCEACASRKTKSRRRSELRILA